MRDKRNHTKPFEASLESDTPSLPCIQMAKAGQKANLNSRALAGKKCKVILQRI